MAEFDGILAEVPLPAVAGWQVFRYWPGHTTTSMAWLVRSTMMPIVAGFAPRGRTLARSLRGAAGSHSPMTIVGVHLPVTDDPYPESLADLAELIARRRRGAVVYIVGDTNAQWPPAGRRSAEQDATGTSSTTAAPGNRASRHKNTVRTDRTCFRSEQVSHNGAGRRPRWSMELGMCADDVHTHSVGRACCSGVSVVFGWRVEFGVFRSQCSRCRHRTAAAPRGPCLLIDSDHRLAHAARSAAVAAGIG